MFPSLIHLFYQPVYCVNLRLTAYLNNLPYFDYQIIALSGEYQSNCYRELVSEHGSVICFIPAGGTEFLLKSV